MHIQLLKVAVSMSIEMQMIFNFFVFTFVTYKFPCYLKKRCREMEGMEEERLRRPQGDNYRGISKLGEVIESGKEICHFSLMSYIDVSMLLTYVGVQV